MTRHYVALLRGINVGRAKRVSMDDLRSVVASLGYRDPRTLLNSGNVVFCAPDLPPDDVAGRLEAALCSKLGVSSRVTVLSAAEFSAVVADNPLLGLANDSSRLLVVFLRDPSDTARLQPLVQQDWQPEVLALGERVAYSWCPGGVTASVLLPAIDRVLGDAVTSRNWATVLKLQDLLERGATLDTSEAGG